MPAAMTRRRLLLTTALVPVWAACRLVPELDAEGRVVVWVNPLVLARLRAAIPA
jgi:hypothetical protein